MQYTQSFLFTLNPRHTFRGRFKLISSFAFQNPTLFNLCSHCLCITLLCQSNPIHTHTHTHSKKQTINKAMSDLNDALSINSISWFMATFVLRIQPKCQIFPLKRSNEVVLTLIWKKGIDLGNHQRLKITKNVQN